MPFGVFPIFSFWWFLEPFLDDFFVVDLRPLLCGFGWGCMHEPFIVLFLVISLSNLWEKVLDLGLFLGFGKVVFLVEIFRFLSIYQVLGDQIVAMGCPWGTSSIPKVLCKSMERIRRSGRLFGRVDPWLVVHPELPRPDRSNRCVWPVWSVPGPCGVCLGWIARRV
jgi:hypothetical protein